MDNWIVVWLTEFIMVFIINYMKLGDNTLNNEELSVVKTIFLTKYISELL